MDAPQTVSDLLWWAMSGAIFLCVALCATLLGLLLGKLEKISTQLEVFQLVTNRQDKAIVEIQTRCSMNHGTPIVNHFPAEVANG